MKKEEQNCNNWVVFNLTNFFSTIRASSISEICALHYTVKGYTCPLSGVMFASFITQGKAITKQVRLNQNEFWFFLQSSSYAKEPFFPKNVYDIISPPSERHTLIRLLENYCMSQCKTSVKQYCSWSLLRTIQLISHIYNIIDKNNKHNINIIELLNIIDISYTQSTYSFKLCLEEIFIYIDVRQWCIDVHQQTYSCRKERWDVWILFTKKGFS